MKGFIVVFSVFLTCILTVSTSAFASAELEERLASAVGAEDIRVLAEAVDVQEDALKEIASAHASWEMRLQAELVRLWRRDSAHAAALFRMEPMRTRMGTLRFVGPLRSAPDAWMVHLHRLHFGTESLAMRMAFVEVLSIVQEPLVVEALVARMKVEEEAELRVRLVVALMASTDLAALSALELGLKDGDARVRAVAVSAVAEHVEGHRLQGSLPEALQDDDARVRANAARAMGWLQIQESADLLDQAIGDESPLVRDQALRALARVAPERARARARTQVLQQDPDPRVGRTVSVLAKESD